MSSRICAARSIASSSDWDFRTSLSAERTSSSPKSVLLLELCFLRLLALPFLLSFFSTPRIRERRSNSASRSASTRSCSVCRNVSLISSRPA